MTRKIPPPTPQHYETALACSKALNAALMAKINAQHQNVKDCKAKMVPRIEALGAFRVLEPNLPKTAQTPIQNLGTPIPNHEMTEANIDQWQKKDFENLHKANKATAIIKAAIDKENAAIFERIAQRIEAQRVMNAKNRHIINQRPHHLAAFETAAAKALKAPKDGLSTPALCKVSLDEAAALRKEISDYRKRHAPFKPVFTFRLPKVWPF